MTHCAIVQKYKLCYAQVGPAKAQFPSTFHQKYNNPIGGVILAIPTALLRRFYVQSSLKNETDGVAFQLVNRIAPTTIVSLGPIEVDGALYAPDQILVTASKARHASAIHDQAPFFLRMGKKMKLSIPGEHLKPGRHHIVLHAVTKEVGPVSIEFEEVVQ